MKRAIEPVRQSVLEIVQKNLRAIGEKIRKIINDIKSDYTDILVSGLLVIYPRYYIHVLEAPEDIIYKHFDKICAKDDANQQFMNGLLLPSYHHVYQRFFREWFCVNATPPRLVDKPEAHNLADIQKHVTNFLLKVYTLCEYVSNIVCDVTVDKRCVFYNGVGRASVDLPESNFIEFLINLKADVLEKIEDYVKVHSAVPNINLYNDGIWPASRDFKFRSAPKKDIH